LPNLFGETQLSKQQEEKALTNSQTKKQCWLVHKLVDFFGTSNVVLESNLFYLPKVG